MTYEGSWKEDTYYGLGMYKNTDGIKYYGHFYLN